MKNIFNNLLFKVVCGILFGIALGYYAPEWLYRILITFQVLFSNFLKFAIPLILIGLIMPSISDLGKNAGRLLLITIGIAYAFTLFSGFSTYLVGESLFPSLLQGRIRLRHWLRCYRLMRRHWVHNRRLLPFL